MASSYTPHYNLDKYIGTDKPNLRDQYNAAMDKIDTALLAANTNATEAKAATLSFQDDLNEVSDAVSAEVSARQTAVSNEATARQNADAALAEDIADNTTAINNEVSARQTAVSNEATARQNADTSLSTAISNEATARQNADTALQTDIANVSNKKMLVFGDSWIAHANSTLVSGSWVPIVQHGLGLSGYACYAKAGAKVSTTTGNRDSVYSQIQDAIANIPTKERPQYEYAFIMGGINDYNSGISVADLQSGIESSLNLLKDAFPKTKIVLVGPNVFYDAGIYRNTKFKDYRYTFVNAAANAGVICLPYLASWFLLFGQSVFRPNDDSSYSADGGTYHPNNRGNKAIAKYIINSLEGNGDALTVPINFTSLNNVTIDQQRSYADERNIYLNLKLTIPTFSSANFYEIGLANWDNRPMVLTMNGLDGNTPAPNPSGLTPDNIVKMNERGGSMWITANQPGKLVVFSGANGSTYICTLTGVIPRW